MRLALLMILLAFTALALAGCPQQAGGPTGDYRNPARGFTVTFPAGWEVKENELGLDVIGLSPAEGPSDQFRDNVTVSSSVMPSPLDPGAILDANIPSMIKVITDFQPGERGRAPAGPAEAAWLRYTQRQGVFRLTVTLYALAGKQRAYLIHCTSETSARERFQPKCDEVVNTFRITE